MAEIDDRESYAERIGTDHEILEAAKVLAGIAIGKGATVNPLSPCGLDIVLDALSLKETLHEIRNEEEDIA